MGQHEVVVDVKYHQLMLDAVLVLAQRGDPTPDRRHTLANVQVEPLDKGGTLILDSRLVMGQVWRKRLFLQALHRGLADVASLKKAV